MLPVIFNVAALIMAFCGVDYMTGADVLMVNLYLEVVGVPLATLVCSGTQWEKVKLRAAGEVPVLLEDCPEQSMPSIKFASSDGVASQVQSNVYDGRAIV